MTALIKMMLAASLAVASAVPVALAQTREPEWTEVRDDRFVLRARLPSDVVDAIATV